MNYATPVAPGTGHSACERTWPAYSNVPVEKMPFPSLPNSIGLSNDHKLNASFAEFSRRAGECKSSAEVYSEFDRALKGLIDYHTLVIRIGNPKSGVMTETIVRQSPEANENQLVDQKTSTFSSAKTSFADSPIVLQDCTDPTAIKSFPFLKDSTGKLQSLANVPLKHHGAVVGSMTVLAGKKEAFSKRNVQTLQVAAAHIAPIMMNSLHVTELEKEVRERTILAEISRTVSSSIDLQLVWEEFAQAVQSLLPCDRLVVTIMEEGIQKTRSKYIWGVSLPNWDELPDRKFSNQSQAVADSKKAAIISIEESDRHSMEQIGYRISEKIGLNSMMIAPLVAGNQVIGTLNIRSLLRDAYTEDHLALFEVLAMQIAGSVAASELYARSINHAEEIAAKSELEFKNKHLVETDATRSRFIASITHELRTPMTSIIAAAERLRADEQGHATDKHAQYLDMIGRNTKRLHELIESLLDIADIEDDELWLSNSEFTLYGAVKEALSAIRPIAESKFQRLTTEFPAIDIVINADRDRLIQVLKNLLSNACRYSPNYKEVRLSVRNTNGELEFCVIDHGFGISEDDVPLVFDEFSRLGNEITKANSGTGLGLPLSRKLARAMGGDITVSSEIDKGSTFTLTLPAELVVEAA